MFVEELNQSGENSSTKKESMQHTKTRLEKSLKKKWDSKIMHEQYIRCTDKQLVVKKTHSYGRSESRN